MMPSPTDITQICPRIEVLSKQMQGERDLSRCLISLSFADVHIAHPERPDLLGVGLPQLPTPAPIQIEYWEVDSPVKRGVVDAIAYNYNDAFLFGWILTHNEKVWHDLRHATTDAYLQLLTFIRDSDYPHLLRIWNYFPAIHQDIQGIDRYQHFCLGRYDALSQYHLKEHELPAATAIGTQTPGLLIYFLAAKNKGRQVENPRQVSAFQYPRCYGPQSPSFSRATLSQCAQNTQLYISGTASIVGHASLHQDFITQTSEILNNMHTLLQQASLGINKLEDLDMIKVYIRNPAHQADIERYLRDVLGKKIPVIYLAGDICRKDLLVEIEGLCLNCQK